MLLEAGANPNIKKYNGSTPLSIACENGLVSAIDTLLEHGAKIDYDVEKEGNYSPPIT